jgi:glycosyltransferase involved in cell wall biosynthesis
MKKMKENPLVSFCISTYKRHDFILTMVREILKQKYPHFEIVICDNDPESDLAKKLAKLKSKKISYHNNHKNLDMVKSFNRAFRLSKGDFIVFMSDDDPPYPHMLADLVGLYRKYPDCVAYFGAYDLYTPDTKLAQKTKLQKGKFSCRNFDWPRGAVKVFEPKEYLKKALDGDIFYYLMWSTGIVKRQIVKKVGAIPDYTSALMSDRSYCLKVGTLGNVLIYNKELGIQTVHQQSYSLTSSGTKMLVGGFTGYYKNIFPWLKKFHLQKEHEAFVLRHVVNMFMIIKVSDELSKRKTDVAGLMIIFDKIATKISSLKKHRFAMQMMLRYRIPFEALFKATQLPPQKLLKVATHFVKFRLQFQKSVNKKGTRS